MKGKLEDSQEPYKIENLSLNKLKFYYFNSTCDMNGIITIEVVIGFFFLLGGC